MRVALLACRAHVHERATLRAVVRARGFALMARRLSEG